MSAEDVIARVQREHCATVDHYGRRCACGNIPRGDCPFDSPEAEGEWYEMHADHVAAVVLDALRSNGFEVVELPGRDEIDADGQLYFADGDVRVDLSGSRSGAPSVWLGRDETSPERLRAEAAEYLAAARHAEEGTP